MTDEDCRCVLDEALRELVSLRSPMYHGDALAALHALSSLVKEANGRVPRLVADSRDQFHTWREISRQLGRNRVLVIARYVARTKKRRTPLDPD